MMEGFGVHTFRLVNAHGRVDLREVPLEAGARRARRLVWDEAVKIAGADPDFHRRDLCEAIDSGDFPEWELGVQVVRPGDGRQASTSTSSTPTKLIPEEIVPLHADRPHGAEPQPRQLLRRDRAGRLPSRPHRARASTSRNDPLLQGRLFSYLDTQLIRLGGPNFHQIPINRAGLPVPQLPARRPHADAGAAGPRQLRAQLARPRRRRARTRRSGFASFPDPKPGRSCGCGRRPSPTTTRRRGSSTAR